MYMYNIYNILYRLYMYIYIYIYIKDVVITFANLIITTQLLSEISCNDYNCN